MNMSPNVFNISMYCHGEEVGKERIQSRSGAGHIQSLLGKPLQTAKFCLLSLSLSLSRTHTCSLSLSPSLQPRIQIPRPTGRRVHGLGLVALTTGAQG